MFRGMSVDTDIGQLNRISPDLNSSVGVLVA